MFSKHSDVMVDLLKKEVGKGAFSFKDYIADYNLETGCETTMGANVHAQGAHNHALKAAIDEMCEIGAWRICQPWFRSDFLFKMLPCYDVGLKHRKTLYDFLLNVIKDKQILAERDAAETFKKETRDDSISFLDLQLKSPEDQRLTEQELLGESILLVLASLDIAGTGTGFAVLMLSRYPDVQEKVYQELLEVFGDTNRPITVKDMPELKFLEAVIKESLRLFPPVPLFVRRVDEDFTLPSGMTIVKDCGMLVNVWAVHCNPSYWGEDADQFRPERFLNSKPKHPAAFLAFSTGPRNCIGCEYTMMSLETVLSTLLRRYRVLPPPEVESDEPVRTKFDLMLKHVHKFEVQLENRI